MSRSLVWTGRFAPVLFRSMTSSPSPRIFGAVALLALVATACDVTEPPVDVLTGTWAQVSVGGGHACLVSRDGEAACWGANDRGQLGTGRVSAAEADPETVAGGLSFQVVSAGLRHTCGLDGGGEVWCWGANEVGQLGDGTAVDRVEPTRIAVDGPFVSVSAGGAHTCAVRASASALCWGANEVGQAGAPPQSDGLLPVVVGADLQFASVRAGPRHSCGLSVGGEAFCWGPNPDGRLGAGTLNGGHQPQSVAGDQVFRALSAGTAHSCGLDSEGRAWCWGSNARRQVSEGSAELLGSPFARGDSLYADIEAGDGWTCGVGSEGQLRCWGARWDSVSPGEPVPLSPGGWTPLGADPSKTVLDLSMWGRRACALRGDGGVECWGR